MEKKELFLSKSCCISLSGKIQKVTWADLFCLFLEHLWASLVTQLVKNLSATQETVVHFPGREDLLEKR